MRTILSVLTLGLVGTTALAHHTYSDFALDRSSRVEGTVVGVRFQNPHVLIRLRGADSNVYTAEWHGAEFLQSHPELVVAGSPVRNDTLRFGDRLVIVGSPSRDETLRGLANLKEVRRLNDGWMWQAGAR